MLLRPFWCGICGTDLHEYAQGPIVTPDEPHRLNGSTIPQILGHEFSAEVVEVGAGVTRVWVGQRVSVMPLLFDGTCYYCVRGLNHLCVNMACIGLSYAWGGIAELAVVPEEKLTVLPDAVSDLQGALVEPAAVAAYGVDTAKVRPGDTVLITGAGPIGALAVALRGVARRARDRVGGEPDPGRARPRVRHRRGARPHAVDVAAYLKDLNGGIGADAVIECSGNERALQTALAAVRSAGHVSQTGLHTRPASIDPMVLSEHDITLTGTWCYPVFDFPRIVDLIARGRYPVEQVVTGRVADGRHRREGLRDAALADRRPGQGPHRDALRARDRMRALVYTAQDAPGVEERPIPEIAADEVLVAARSVGVCHSDIELLEGRYIIPFSYPLIPGHEWSGEVVRVGDQVRGFAVGDRVVGECVIGADHFGFSISGAAADFFVAKESWLHRLPDELSYTMGALVEPFSVAYYAIKHAGGVDASDTVVVLGAGPVGLAVAAATSAMGATTVVVEPSEDRRAAALALGRAARRASRRRRGAARRGHRRAGRRPRRRGERPAGRDGARARARRVPGPGRLHRHRRGRRPRRRSSG